MHIYYHCNKLFTTHISQIWWTFHDFFINNTL